MDIHVVDSEWMLGSEYTTKKQKEMKEAPNGFEINGAIYWNVDSDKPMMYVVGHEVLHHIKTYVPNEYKELRDTLLTACLDRGRLQLEAEIVSMQSLYKQHGAELSREKAIEEIIANQMYGLTESETFWNALEEDKPSLARKILDAIRDILHKIRTTLMGEESFDENISNSMYESLGILTDMEELTAKALIKAKANRLAVGAVNRNGVSYVLKGYDKDNIEIYETSKETMDKTWSERKQLAVEIITKEYKGKTAKFKDKNGNVTYARFDKVTAKKNIYGDKNSSKAGKDAKVNAIADGDFINLIENSDADQLGVLDNAKHPHKDVNSWSYYIKTVAIDGVYYDETINIKNTNDGEYVYEVSLEENAKKKGIVPLITRQYSISPASGLEATIPLIDNSISSDANDSNNNTQFSISNPIEESGSLVAVHNLKEADLENTLKLGGFPMPSIAIVKRNSGHNEYGSISVLFDKSTIDPEANADNEVYSGDAWTPVYPTVEYKANKEITDIIDDKVRFIEKNKVPEGVRRAVTFDEVKGVLVPDDINSELKDNIKSMGMDVYEYASGNEDDRRDKLNEVATSKNINFSISPKLETELEAVKSRTFSNEYNENNEVYIGESSDFLTNVIGADAFSVTMPQKKAYQAMVTKDEAIADGVFKEGENYHGLDVDGLIKVLESAEKPLLAITSAKKFNNRIVLLTDQVDYKGNPILVVQALGTDGRTNGKITKSNKYITSYGKKKLKQYINKLLKTEKILFYDKNNSHIIEGYGLQLSANNDIYDYSNNVKEFWDNVNNATDNPDIRYNITIC